MDIRELFQLISDYLDRELEPDISSEIEEFICLDQECRTLVNTFRETINLCYEIEDLEVPEQVHIKLYQFLQIEIETDQDPEDS